MITGFEKQTHDLCDAELKLLPVFVAGFASRRGKEKSISNKEIIGRLSQRGIVISEPRVRKIINHIRNRGIIEGLIATSKGYYISENKEEITSYIESLQSREDAIRTIKEGFMAYSRQLNNK